MIMILNRTLECIYKRKKVKKALLTIEFESAKADME